MYSRLSSSLVQLHCRNGGEYSCERHTHGQGNHNGISMQAKCESMQKGERV
jgi:hypothetical protein